MARKSTIIMERMVPPAPRQGSFFLSLIILVLGLWSVGFSMFLADINNTHSSENLAANAGISVFTGGPNRLTAGMDLFNRSAGEGRLLVSGVNEATSREAVRSHVADPNGYFECCVDLDYVSTNTIQNAAQSIQWAQENGFEALTIVTSYYHMPRALLELSQIDHDLEIYPYEVFPDNHDENSWWHPRRFRTLSTEYAKYELALMRIRLSNLLK